MIGAIIGDIVGSRYEFHPTHDYNFEWLRKRSNHFTDDTIMTIAVAIATKEILTVCPESEMFLENETGPIEVKAQFYKNHLIKSMHKYGYVYSYCSYGKMFSDWLAAESDEPYNSYGNGSAMRVSSIGWFFDDLYHTLQAAKWSAEVTHNHPEGIKGAMATAHAIWLARHGYDKDYIRNAMIQEYYGDAMCRSLDDIRNSGYRFNATCQKSVPEAIIAFLESTSYVDCIRKAVTLGGDSDTQACIAGAIAEAYYYPHGELWRLVNLKDNTDPFLNSSILGFMDESIIMVLQYIYKNICGYVLPPNENPFIYNN